MKFYINNNHGVHGAVALPVVPILSLLLSLFSQTTRTITTTNAFTFGPHSCHHHRHPRHHRHPAATSTATATTPAATRTCCSTQLSVSIGLGPEQQDDANEQDTKTLASLIPGVDYEIPNHELFRTVRRTPIDETCDAWFQSLLEPSSSSTWTSTLASKDDDNNNHQEPFLGEIAKWAKQKLVTPVELKNEIMLPQDHVDYTAYVNEKFPWDPLLPAYGLEQFGLPTPRRNADTWRHFDVTGMVAQDYSGIPEGMGLDLILNDNDLVSYQSMLLDKGAWLEDDAVTARLIYVNGRFCPQLSKTTESIYNLTPRDLENKHVNKYLTRLTDGFTDELAAPVPSGPADVLTSFSKLSFPHHNVGDPTSQFAVNAQQGTACFAALNTVKTGAVAMIRSPKGSHKDTPPNELKPVLLVNAISRNMACPPEQSGGTACHPRTLVIAEDGSHMSIVQSCVDLEIGEDRPTLYNGYTQVFIHQDAHVSHSYLEETGGMVTGGTELTDNEVPSGTTPPRVLEASRPTLKDTHLEAIDVHVVGEDGTYSNTVMSIGGSGRVRIALSVSLLRPASHASIQGFSLSGGAQRTDMKTNIHHMAQGTTSEQVQKCMIGGRATGAFRGRIRVEQSAQQTESSQLSRTILLSDRCRAWMAPTLEIIADDVQCTHGATVSDLSEEELFYLRSRGLDQSTARNMLMYAFAGDISVGIHPSMRGEVDSKSGVTHRVIQRLENLVPRGDRKVKGQFQSV